MQLQNGVGENVWAKIYLNQTQTSATANILNRSINLAFFPHQLCSHHNLPASYRVTQTFNVKSVIFVENVQKISRFSGRGEIFFRFLLRNQVAQVATSYYYNIK